MTQLQGVNRRRRIVSGGGFDPVAFTGGAVTAIYSVPLATVTGSGVSSMPDTLGGNPAVQLTTDIRRPPRITTATGKLVLQAVDDILTVAPHAAITNQVTWGFAGWMALDVLGVAVKNLVRAGAITSLVDNQIGDAMKIDVSTTDQLRVRVNTNSGGVDHRVGTAGQLSTAYRFMTVELNLAAATEAEQVTITQDAVVQSVAFSSSGSGTAMPASMQPTTDLIVLLNRRSSTGTSPYVGRIGPLIYILGAKMPGATEGLLTPAARLGLMNVERPANAELAVVGGASQAFATLATQHDVDVSALAGAGRKLVMVFSTGNISTATAPSGWTQVGTTNDAVTVSCAIFWKTSDGTETTASVVLGTSSGACARTYAIAGAHAGEPEKGTATLMTSASNTTNDPGAVAPSWGAARNLYLAFLLVDRSIGPPNVTVYPAGYDQTGEIQSISASAGINCALAFGEKIATSSSEEPSAWTYGPGRSIAITVAVRPE